MQPMRDADGDGIDILPVVVVMQTFLARPSSVPDIRDFVRRYLNQTSLSEAYLRSLCQRVEGVLLESAGTDRMIQVSLRIFGGFAEVDVLQTTRGEMVGDTGSTGAPLPLTGSSRAQPEPVPAGGHGITTRTDGNAAARSEPPEGPGPVCAVADRTEVSFAGWLGDALRREGMTMEAAARELKVSVKTVSRWIGGMTEPRLRDLSRMRELFGDLPWL